MRPFDLLRSELMTLLHQTFKNYLQPPTMKPLHEIFFFTATATVRRHLVGKRHVLLKHLLFFLWRLFTDRGGGVMHVNTTDFLRFVGSSPWYISVLCII